MQQFSIPDNLEGQNGQATFGAGDTTFLQLNPVWDSDYGITDPTEISIAQDGRIFIADSTSRSIIVLDQNGNISEEISGLNNLKDYSGADISPVDVDIDQKMNVFFIDGSQRIFVWNLYWNQIGIKNVSVSASFKHTETGIEQVESSGTDNWFSLLNSSEWEIADTVFSNSPQFLKVDIPFANEAAKNIKGISSIARGTIEAEQLIDFKLLLFTAISPILSPH